MYVRTRIWANFLLSKRWPPKSVHGCLETKIGKVLTFKTFISLDALPSPPSQNKIAFTYVVKLLHDEIVLT